jgi:hypothetical protein
VKKWRGGVRIGVTRDDELKKLKSLLDDGAIAQDEYDRLRVKIPA